MTGIWGWSSSGFQGQSPWWGLWGKAFPKAEHIYNYLTVNFACKFAHDRSAENLVGLLYLQTPLGDAFPRHPTPLYPPPFFFATNSYCTEDVMQRRRWTAVSVSYIVSARYDQRQPSVMKIGSPGHLSHSPPLLLSLPTSLHSPTISSPSPGAHSPNQLGIWGAL